MPAVIIYMSLHGCAEKAAQSLKEMNWKKTDLVNLRNKPVPDLNEYDTVIIGGSVHMGQIQGKIRKFCNTFEKELLTKRLGLYLCHMYEGETAVRQFNDAYSERLRNHAVAKGLFGGEFCLDKMNFFEKALVKKAAGAGASISKINQNAIEGFGRVIFHLDKS